MKNTIRSLLSIMMLVIVFQSSWVHAAENFASLVGPVKIGPVSSIDPIETPFITWGGDVATFHANGGLNTTSSSVYAGLGLNLKMVPGDDFVGQVQRYLKGESPFLRGTVRMMGMASELLGSNPETKPVMFLQLTWSAGDHMVSRGNVETLNDLKGKKIVLQQGGPHVGMLDDVLKAAQLSWKDINVVWTDELTGPNGPADLFKKDRSIDACLVISPDMVGLVGGLDATGSGAGGTIKGAKVLVSTAQMSRSIADVYVVRKDFFDAHRDIVEKFAAGYLKATEELIALKKAFEATGENAAYYDILKLTQTIYGKEVIPTLEVDAHGLISDASFVGLPGNVSFFTDAGNLSGYEAKQQDALALATEQGFARGKVNFINAKLDYKRLASLSNLTSKSVQAPTARFAEMSADDLFPDDPIEKASDTILTFTISFEPNQSTFSVSDYGDDFQRAIEAASTFGNAAIAVGGHADPTLMLRRLVEAGIAKGNLSRTGSGSSTTYTLDGKPLDLTATADILKAIKSGSFAGSTKSDPKNTMVALEKLSQERATAVKQAIIDYAKGRGLRLDASQIKPVGVGVREPVVAKPTSPTEARRNMRVEFRLIKVPSEVIKASDFDF